MIVKNWMKAIALAGVAGMIPAVGFAKAHHTASAGSDFANVVNPVVVPATSVTPVSTATTLSTKHTKGVVKHHKKKLTSIHHKHKVLSHKKLKS